MRTKHRYGRAFEPSSRRPANPLAKLATRKIEQIDNREVANAMWSAEADLEPVSFFIFVLGVHPKSPEAAGKRDIFFAFSCDRRWAKFN